MNKSIILVVIAEFWMTIGQICFKKSANHLSNRGRPPIFTKVSHAKIGRCPLFLSDPTLWLGAAAMLVGLFFWFAALASGQLSFVYLLGSIQYILALIGARIFLHERINFPKLFGTLLILLGIILTAFS